MTPLADALLLTAAVLAAAFVGRYATRSRWRLNPVGRSLMYVMGALAAVLAQNSASVYIGTDYLGREVVRLLLYAALVLTLLGLLRTLFREQRGPLPFPDRRRAER